MAETVEREPIEKNWRGFTVYACPVAGCAFDTDNRATMLAHLDPTSGKHPEIIYPAAPTSALSDDEHAELVDLREKYAEAVKENRTLKGRVTRLSKQLADHSVPEQSADEPMDALDETTADEADSEGA